MIKSGVYAIVNMLNGKRYIGSSVNIARRFVRHRFELNKGIHENPHLQRAWLKYGRASFVFIVVEETHPEEMLEREQYHVDRFVAAIYNVGLIVKAPSVGREVSAETRAKISARHKGKKLSKEQVDGMRARMIGTKMLPQTALAIRQSHVGRVQPLEERAKRSKSLKGKVRSPEHCQAISDAKKGRPQGPLSIEARQKLSLFRREYWRKKREGAA